MHLTLTTTGPDELTTIAELARSRRCAHETVKRRLAEKGVAPDAILRTGSKVILLFSMSRIAELELGWEPGWAHQ